jgi:hypothetical protein
LNEIIRQRRKVWWSDNKLNYVEDLKSDQPEQCNSKLGFRENCTRNHTTVRCRMCRACLPEYFPQGVGKCIRCPQPWERFVIVLLALSFVGVMLKLFLTSADRDSSTHAHLAQPLQKILLNHLHLTFEPRGLLGVVFGVVPICRVPFPSTM